MKATSDKPPEISKQQFEAIKVQVMQRYGKFTFEATELTIQDAIRDLIIRLDSFILGQHDYQKYKVYIAVPANWWEHLKQDRFPKWYIKRFPVKTKAVGREITFDHKKLFPKSDIMFPPNIGPVVFHSHTEDPDVHKQ